MIDYKNRYGDVYNFIKDSDGNIIWTGKFEYVRTGYPNKYDKAYEQYLEDSGNLGFEDFITELLEYFHEKDHPMRKYVILIESVKDKIDFIDPSGGPFIGVGANMGRFSETFEDMIVEDIIEVEDGYKLIIKKQ
jgi:hypothetical protein